MDWNIIGADNGLFVAGEVPSQYLKQWWLTADITKTFGLLLDQRTGKHMVNKIEVLLVLQKFYKTYFF